MTKHSTKLALLLLLGNIISCAGTRELRDAPSVTKATPLEAVTRATPQVPLEVAYSYSGQGDRPKFVKNPALLIDTIKGGTSTYRIRGMMMSGQCAVIDTYTTYTPAKIKFADGTTKTFSSVTVEGLSGYPPALVTVP